ncbi:antirestriction protein [Longimycelium tulufanense]|uniref:Antirestriction protein n=1 Tax=Longimycelium tulufanense TaxID=907463 RepID=A0A8J3CAK0_9PSEU|nr:antirestriction protein ArdA [Longimycelium tulufanense]GGM39423.1 antirestriction protein [Longimycelium tulufanense]
MDTPQIYIASLADYTDGYLHGEWVDADQDVDSIRSDIERMLKASRFRDAEYAIHDYDGFYGLLLDEWESLDHVSAIGQGIAQHGPAFAAYVHVLSNNAGGVSRIDLDDLSKFEDRARGEWNSFRDYAEDLAREFGYFEVLDKLTDVTHYFTFDVGAFARDLEMDTDSCEIAGRVYVFDLND